MAEAMVDKKNLWILHLEGGEFGAMYGPFSMNTFIEGLKATLVDSNFDESYDSLVGLEIDVKGRPHEYPIDPSVIEKAYGEVEQEIGLEEPDFDDQLEDFDLEDVEEEEC